ncbi:hypothetical protein GWI33_003341 [Rhynchophorus ferrugineus]|uniref:Leprecan-like alpha-helical domain-containing protein n=1 Tax=Rhynchophorus ferrugineus TaxID=354439 RepID=A0A834MKW6_RHYFE|nr:hypothetical protein GWI33_003341 [Rhynchophorus ferrugineus]
MTAYLEDRYEDCVNYFEKALQIFRSSQQLIQNCRLTCKQESDYANPLYPVDVEDLMFYDKTLRNTLCIVKCRQENVNDIYDDVQKFQDIFDKRIPYEYLNLCYFKVNSSQKAASSAFTFLVANPDHELMRINLKRYSELPDVQINDIINYEAKEYIYLYFYGCAAYEKKDWNAVINYMEKSLFSYLQSEDECRSLCEGPFDAGFFFDFIPSISNHFTYVLKCKRNCQKKLANLNGKIHEDLLPSHYHYLQYAYFKKGNFLAACEAVASYLLFVPDDETMLNNMRYYIKQPKAQKEYFIPRKEAVRYIERDTYEKRIIQFIKKEFVFSKNASDKSKVDSLSNDQQNEDIELDDDSQQLVIQKDNLPNKQKQNI